MKTVGIIGGLGPETTSKFYLELIFSCKKINQTSYPPILVNSVPLPFDIERYAIMEGVGEEKCLPYLLQAAKSLEQAGADFLVLPCNSLHLFIEDIRKIVKIPVISILEETSKFLKERKIKKVGVIGTSITIRNRLYEKSLKQSGIKQILPNDFQQVQIARLIYNLVSSRYDNNDQKVLIKVIGDFTKGKAEHIILACTDLQLLMPQHNKIKIYDTMKILADATIKYILK
ncbi:hypothetical protein A3C67_02285 [Candidatus Nomurabacteria bacterium RIFCSPHIGHO2_02_FULL_42_19]|uniref:Aspartate racemase n=1 Tax=Candidatus Nomurabacteria bacterium RIFCSPHIGHO2_02_FULL_42_19 TaxID=1801756 RepID=A0A1F6W3B5_9BACT|nr:MAG: hypothetical protein A3C67_02285 [Candidatus Nomurabacteria bacterium RIFCSPHIGHO2_02_FULL_42_19]